MINKKIKIIAEIAQGFEGNPSYSNLFVNAPYFDFFGHEVWGATAMMLAETAELLKDFKLE